MIKVKFNELPSGGKVAGREIRSNRAWYRLQYRSRAPFKGAFAHIGAIGGSGRESYSKFTAVFGASRFPGSNCGISILGIGSL